jgi:zinc protease
MMRARFAWPIWVTATLMLILGHSEEAQSVAHPRPAVGELAITHPPNAAREKLPNGIEVIQLPFGSTPKTEIRVVLSLANDPSRPERQAMLTTIWQRGMSRLFGDALRDSIEHLGGSLAVTSSTGGVSLSLDLLSSELAAGLALVAGIVRAPAIDSSLVATLDQNRSRRASREGDAGDAGGRAVELFQHAMLGTEMNREAVPRPRTSADISAAYAGMVTPDHVRIYLTGKFDEARARRAVSSAFGGWSTNKRSATRTSDVLPSVAPSDSARLILVHHQGARQSGIVVGAFIPLSSNTLFPQLRVLDALLGGNLNSRITMNIREARGYAYSPASRLVRNGADRAYWAEVTDVAADVTWPTLREILHEIEAVTDSNPPTAAEANGTARFVVGSALMQRSSRSGWADEVAEGQARGEAWNDWDKNLSRVLAVTPSQLRSVAQRFLAPKRLTVVVVGDTTLMGAQTASIRAAVKRLNGG